MQHFCSFYKERVLVIKPSRCFHKWIFYFAWNDIYIHIYLILVKYVKHLSCVTRNYSLSHLAQLLWCVCATAEVKTVFEICPRNLSEEEGGNGNAQDWASQWLLGANRTNGSGGVWRVTPLKFMVYPQEGREEFSELFLSKLLHSVWDKAQYH